MLRGFSKARFLRGLRLVHTWLGVVVVPWILIIGATGFYLNHSRSILAMIEVTPYDEANFADWSGARPIGQSDAQASAVGIWPEQPIEKSYAGTYHDKAVFIFEKPSGQIIFTQDTGHYFVKTWMTRTTYAPDGTRLHRRVYWGSIFKQLHTTGWLGGSLGSWLADITSLAMVVFGITGSLLWWMPRARQFGRVFRLTRAP